MSKNPLQANQERLDEIRRKRAERLNQMGGSANTSRTQSQIIRRQLSAQQSEGVHVSGSIIETYEKEIQVVLETRSLDSKPAYNDQEDDKSQQIDLLQPKEHKRKRDQNKNHNDFNVVPAKQLSPEELDSLVKSKHFNDFFNRSSKFLEKVLDNGDGDMIQLMLKDGIKSKNADSHNVLKAMATFSDPTFTGNRVVTDLDWSTQIPQLFLTSYSQNQHGNIKDHVGVVLVWTPSLRTRPEFYCFCQSAVTSAKFFPYSNSTIIGGCYNGQLLLWDVRAKAMPVQRSGISSDGHKYPVNSLNVIGTQIANNVVSFSNDGTMGIWDVKQFSKPVKVSKFGALRPTRTNKLSTILPNMSRMSSGTTNPMERPGEMHDVNVTCCQFPLGDANKYYVGSLNGAMYKNAMHNNNVEKITMYDEHDGPISSISINNPSSEYQALSGLVLTSSYDWTVKLWSPNSTKQSMRTFEHSDDYIYDVCWNPSNPSIFASVNNEGMMDLFDLTRDVEQPLSQVKINSYAQNKCKWNAEGSVIISGDSAGNVSLLGLGERYRKLENARLDDFETVLTQNKDEV